MDQSKKIPKILVRIRLLKKNLMKYNLIIIKDLYHKLSLTFRLKLLPANVKLLKKAQWLATAQPSSKNKKICLSQSRKLSIHCNPK